MSLKYYKISNLKPLSKPRGALGKYGNITHSLHGYRNYQETFHNRLKQLNFSIPVGFYSIIYLFKMRKAKGQKNDLTNMVGAIEDIFVRYGYVSDDNYSVIKRCWCEAVQDTQSYCITLLTVENESDLLYFFKQRAMLLDSLLK